MAGRPFEPGDTDEIPKVQPGQIMDREDRKRDQRHREVDKMYSNFTKAMQEPKILEYADWLPYHELYVKPSEEVLNADPSSEIAKHYRNLSEDLLKKVDMYREYYVRLPNGEYRVFPPLYSPVAPIMNSKQSAVDIMHNIQEKCEDQPWRRESATANLVKSIYDSQNPKIHEIQTTKFMTIAKQMHETVISRNQAIEEDKPVTSAPSSDLISSMEFVPDE